MLVNRILLRSIVTLMQSMMRTNLLSIERVYVVEFSFYTYREWKKDAERSSIFASHALPS